MLLLAFGAFYCITASSNTTDFKYNETTPFYYSESDVKNRIENSSSLLSPHYEQAVQFFVKDNLYHMAVDARNSSSLWINR